jgi:predicted methyltransferase
LAWPGMAATVANDGSWIYYLGQPSQNQKGQGSGPSISKRLRLYSFIVTAEINVIQDSSVVQTYTYGHDPGMGVKG